MNSSVIMPVYNAEKTVFEAVKSVLGQSYNDFEFIIIDDGSTDNTLAILKSFDDARIKIICNTVNKGIVECLNRGIQQAQGQYIFRMDADDIAHADRFEKQLRFMEDNPDCAICGSYVREFGCSNRMYNFDTQSSDIKIDLLFFNTINHPSIVLNRKNIKLEDLYFDEEFLFAEDYEFFARVSTYAQIFNYPEVLLMYRIHDDQTKTKQKSKQFELAVNISQKQIKNIFGKIEQDQEDACFVIVKAVYGQKSNQSEVEKVKKLFDNLIELNKDKHIFDSQALIQKKKFFTDLVS